MADTRRALADLQALHPDNTTGLISPQDARDALVTNHPSNVCQSGPLSALPSTGQVTGDTFYPTNEPAMYRWDGGAWVRHAFGAGALVLLQQLTAANVAFLPFTSVLSSAYDVYQFEIVNLVPTNQTQDCLVEVSVDGGATWVTTAYYWALWAGGTSGQNIVSTQGGTYKPWWNIAAAVDNTGDGVCGTLKLFGPQTPRARKVASLHTMAMQAGQHVTYVGHCMWGAPNPITGIRFYFATGTVSSGTVRCYGLVK